jgi:dihydropteroate synthase
LPDGPAIATHKERVGGCAGCMGAPEHGTEQRGGGHRSTVMSRRKERFYEVLEGARAERGAALMGICNVTPDSFSDGGRYFSREDAKARVRTLLEEGADLIDIGGESTRPGAVAVPAKEQLARVLEVVKFAADEGACVSIDTADPVVAAACLDAGACVVNDVSCLRDEGIADVCAANGAVLILMHSREPMSELKRFSAYPDDAYGENIAKRVAEEWLAAASRAMARGLSRDALVMDPGLGFAKNARQSMRVLFDIEQVSSLHEFPRCIGASRKSFLVPASERAGSTPESRIGASIAAALYASRDGACILRVHDVRATRQALDFDRALLESFGEPA